MLDRPPPLPNWNFYKRQNGEGEQKRKVKTANASK